MQRRRLVKVIGMTGAVGAIAGCTGDEQGEEDSGTAEASENGDGEEEETEDEPEIDSDEALEDEDIESTREGLELLEHEFYEDEFSGGVEGVVANNTGEELSYVEIGVVFYNDEEQRIDDSFTNTTDMSDGEEWVFDVMLISAEPDEVEEYSIAVSDNPF